jgi:hypothetical protein
MLPPMLPPLCGEVSTTGASVLRVEARRGKRRPPRIDVRLRRIFVGPDVLATLAEVGAGGMNEAAVAECAKGSMTGPAVSESVRYEFQ